MILDALLRYSNEQAVTADAASTDVVDHGTTVPGLGVGEPMAVVVVVDTAPDATTGDETYVAKLQTDAVSAFSGAEDLAQVTIPRTAKKGAKFVIPVPPTFEMKQYSRLYYDVGGTTPSVTLSAYLVPLDHIDNTRHFADARTIS